jgi:hypothetical protein
MEIIRRATALLLPLVASGAAFAQCSDYTTVHYAGHHLARQGSNSIDALAQTWTGGDYWYYWNASVSSTENKNGSLLHSSSNSVGYGYTASLEWTDSPSSTGAGTYTMSNTHVAQSACSDYTSFNTSDLLYVNLPTISGISAAWFLGSGVSDATNGYYNQAALTGDSNCGAGDTCSSTPYWSVTSGSSNATLSCSVCTSQTLTALAGSSSVGDIGMTISIGGFTSSPFTFTVGTPRSVVASVNGTAISDFAMSDGFSTHIYYSNKDQFGNTLPSIALNEQFGTVTNDQTNNWANPTAGGIGSYGSNEWYDWLYFYSCSGATPLCTNPQTPLSSNAVKHDAQSWRVGSSTVGTGVLVQTDNLQYYVDHGRHTSIVSPVP